MTNIRIHIDLAPVRLTAFAIALGVVLGATAIAAAAPTTAISNVPLLLVQPAHPQVLLALGNSQSMDGDLSGAIMTGSGTVPGFETSSSPLSYSVPAGFTPPAQGADASGQALYTVKRADGSLVDNSPSRLNVAKAAIEQVIDTYAGNTDFGLMDFSTNGGPARYDTWVYYMSGKDGFTFTDTPGPDTYPNPCYDSTSGVCDQINAHYIDIDVTTKPYFVASATSDEPSINDVLYAPSSYPGAFITFDGPHPASPFPPSFTLSDYNNGGVIIKYNQRTSGSLSGTSPTNAGYVPFSSEVLYSHRGFGYYNNVKSGQGNLVVPVTSAGTYPSKSDLDAYKKKFSTYLQPETNLSGSGEIKASAVQAPIAGELKNAYSYFTDGSAPPTSNGCSTQRYVVLLTDGLPTLDLSGKAWPPLGSAAAVGYGVDASFAGDGSLQSTNDQALTDTITEITQLEAAGVKTYIVGLGAGVDPSKNPQAAKTLKAMAVAGGTNDYFAATSPAAVTQQMQVILTQIQAANLSTTAGAVNSTSLRNNSTVYQAKFNSVNTYQDWTGNLLSFRIDSDGKVDTTPGSEQWNAQALLDARNWTMDRRIVTYDPGLGGEPFRWANLSAAQKAALEGSSPGDETIGQERLDYLRGDTSNEQRNGGTFRNRSHLLGDIVNSNPLYVGPPHATDASTGYAAFASAHSDREPMVYVGANDGMLHAFDANTGKELFAFVPDGVFGHLADLTDPGYNRDHEYYADGSPTAGDVTFDDGSWHTLLVAGLNAGGNTIYALDVTDPGGTQTENQLASKVQWEFSDPDMGRSFSQPAIARIQDDKDSPRSVVIFGSGYNNGDGKPYLYIVDAENGTLIDKIDLCNDSKSACRSDLPNGLSSPTVISTNGGLIADAVYVGDLQGNLWKVDLTNPGKYSSRLIFTATDNDGNRQPITTAPVVSLHPEFPRRSGTMVYFGTGRLLGLPDLTDTSTQTFYGVWDDNFSKTTTRSDLLQQQISDSSITTSSGPVAVRTVTDKTVDWDKQHGWYMDLPLSGERVVTPARLAAGKVVFTTFIPSQDPCSAGGSSWLMVVPFANGGEFKEPEIDINGDGKLDTADQANGANPVGMSLGAGMASKPAIVSLYSNNLMALVNKSSGDISSIQLRGELSGRISWRQIQ